MADEVPFLELIRRVRAGDQEAAADLLRTYEPAIRRAVRLRLGDARLRRVMDSQDICQSVFASFFLRAASGQYEVETPDQLIRLLAVMARNKVAKQLQGQRAACRDQRRVSAQPIEEQGVANSDPTPSREVSARELLNEAHRRLSPDERQLVELRHSGHDWAEIAGMVGGTPEALRKKLSRALARVAEELGLDKSS
jgi:RNA polymerase sigma-70 factor (ECF subfamily)